MMQSLLFSTDIGGEITLKEPMFRTGDRVIVIGYEWEDTLEYDGTVGVIEGFGKYAPDDWGPDSKHGYDYIVRMHDGCAPYCWEDHLRKDDSDAAPDATDDAAFAAFIGG